MTSCNNCANKRLGANGFGAPCKHKTNWKWQNAERCTHWKKEQHPQLIKSLEQFMGVEGLTKKLDRAKESLKSILQDLPECDLPEFTRKSEEIRKEMEEK